jgi:excisionase family DNA binding protein
MLLSWEATMEKQEKRWMKPKEAAEYLSVHLHTVYRMLHCHELPGVKLKGAGWRVDRKKLDAFMEGQIEDREKRWRRLFNYR